MNKEPLQHVAIIMDGNRRWAQEHHMPKILGHTEGASTLKKIGEYALKHHIPYLTLYTLSTENLQRTQEELDHLFSLFEKLPEYIADLSNNKVKVNIIGNLALLPEKTQKKLMNVVEATRQNTTLTLTLAIAYGGRDEIVRAIKKATAARIDLQTIDEQWFAHFLDTSRYPEVDLVIRTGGHQRLSNFLPWQTTYAELYFTPIYWPAFNETEFQKAIDWFYKQEKKEENKIRL